MSESSPRDVVLTELWDAEDRVCRLLKELAQIDVANREKWEQAKRAILAEPSSGAR